MGEAKDKRIEGLFRNLARKMRGVEKGQRVPRFMELRFRRGRGLGENVVVDMRAKTGVFGRKFTMPVVSVDSRGIGAGQVTFCASDLVSISPAVGFRPEPGYRPVDLERAFRRVLERGKALRKAV